MIPGDFVVGRMQSYLDAWESAKDHRAIFLGCYLMMTRNMLAAISAEEFEDNAWVSRLLHRFAEYYFSSLEGFEKQQIIPAAWTLAFEAAGQPRLHVLQNLLLGVNAHITYDLVFTLVEILTPEWKGMSPTLRLSRYRDHCHVNEIIRQTIDSVQDQVIERLDPAMKWVDEALGPLDEWMTSWFIADWREEVWENAVHLLTCTEIEREGISRQVEQRALDRGSALLGEGGISKWKDLF